VRREDETHSFLVSNTLSFQTFKKKVATCFEDYETVMGETWVFNGAELVNGTFANSEFEDGDSIDLTKRRSGC
jgi:hypothetical protein